MTGRFFLLIGSIIVSMPIVGIKPQIQGKKLRFVDGIRAVAYGIERRDIVIASELKLRKLDGSATTLEEIITNIAYEHEAREFHLWPTPEEVDKQLLMIGQMNNKSPQELEELFIVTGRTPQEGRRAFAQINAINSLMSFKMGGAIVTDSEIEAYHEQNPEAEPTAYCIEYLVIPFSRTKTHEEQLAQLQVLFGNEEEIKRLQWQEPFWIKETDLAQDKQFVMQLGLGEISVPLATNKGFEIFRLCDKREERLKPLSERYADIAATLRQPKYSAFITNFKNELLDKLSIVYFDVPL